MNWRILPTMTENAYSNMAIDHALYESVLEGGLPIIRFYNWKNGGVSIGNGQNADIVNTRSCSKEHVLYVRRPTGGNAVYHDPEDITYSVIAPSKLFDDSGLGANRKAYSTICGWIIKALSEFGLEAILYGSNDVLVNGKKVAGNAQLPSKVAFLQHGSIFYNASPAVWSKFLNYSPEKLSQIAGLNSFIKKPEQLQKALFKHFTHNDYVDSCKLIPLTSHEMRRINELLDAVYNSTNFFGTGNEKQGKACIVDISPD